MSEYTSYPSVHTVDAAPIGAAVAIGAASAAVAGATVAGAAVAGLLQTMGEAWAATRVIADSTQADSTLVQSPAALRAQFSAEERRAAAALLASHQSPVDVLKSATVIALARTPYHAVGAHLEAPVKALAAAKTVAAAEQARAALLQVVDHDHLGLFVGHLGATAAEASRLAGFEKIEIRRGTDPGRMRVIATDAGGRSLVSEVAADAKGDVRLATEAVGIIDGACHAALDRFDDAIAKIGVRSGPPTRTTTGGVCQLPFAREEHLAKLKARHPAARPARSVTDADAVDEELARRRALNQPSHSNRAKR